MAKPATVTWGADTSRVQVAYVKSRQVLQLTGPADTTSTLEVPLFEFCHNLGIDARDIGPPNHYLLFAQLHTDPGGTARHVVETFATDDEARETFRALRLRRSHPDDWAEMVSLDAAGRLQPQCWFGTPWGPGGRNRTVPALGRRRVVDRDTQAVVDPTEAPPFAGVLGRPPSIHIERVVTEAEGTRTGPIPPRTGALAVVVERQAAGNLGHADSHSA